MQYRCLSQRYLLIIGSLLLIIFCGASLVLSAAQAVEYLDIRYPGSLLLSEGGTGRFLPNPAYKATASFISQDSYPDVLRWYTDEFGLGIVRQGLEKCTHTYRQNERYGLSYDVAVIVCDTKSGRMIFIEQTTNFRCRWRYCP